MPKTLFAMGWRPSSTTSSEKVSTHHQTHHINNLARRSMPHATAQSITVLFYLFPNSELPSGRVPNTGRQVLAPCGTASDHNAISLRFLAELVGTDVTALSRTLQDRDVFVQLQWHLSDYPWPVNTTLHRVDAARAADLSFTGTLALQTGMATHLAACCFPGQNMAWPGPDVGKAAAVAAASDKVEVEDEDEAETEAEVEGLSLSLYAGPERIGASAKGSKARKR